MDSMRSAGRVFARSVFAGVDAERLLRERYGVTHYLREGEELRHSCCLPFGNHPRGDRSMGAYLNTEKNLYHCFVCGGGDMEWFIKQMEPRTPDGETISTEEALRIARQYQREVDIEQVLGELQQGASVQPGQSPQKGEFDDVIAQWAQNSVDYWKSRGLTQETIELWSLGSMIDSCGIKRAVIPHRWGGKVVGWTARKVDDEVKASKWRHSAGFPKKETLFNYDNVTHFSDVYVVEAPFSAIWLWQAGIKNVVATFGASVSRTQMSLLRRFENVYLWFDADPAGWDATMDAIDMLTGHVNVFVVNSMQGDPADKTAEECRALVKDVIPGMFFAAHLAQTIARQSEE